MKNIILVFAFIIAFVNNLNSQSCEGKATYYAQKFHGRRTSSGEIMNLNAYVCAHQKLPFNTKLKITNKKNGKSVIVRVIDRCPPKNTNCFVDLSTIAAKQIDMIRDGVAKVNIEIVTNQTDTNIIRTDTNNYFKDYFGVLITTNKSKEYANVELERLKKIYSEPIIIKEKKKNGQKLYQVIIGKFEKREEAEKYLNDNRTEFKKAIIFKF